jgi:hypothetical protein
MSNTGLVRLFQDHRSEPFQPLLDISRKPQLFANLFSKTE